jgi:hypothetical protein
MTEQPPKDYVTPQERLADQDWSGVAKTGISSMAPAEKGWILAFVIIFAVFQGANYLVSIKREEAETDRSVRLSEHLISLGASRDKVEENRAQEIRRMQEVIKDLSQTIARQANRDGRAETADQAVRNALKAQGSDTGQ